MSEHISIRILYFLEICIRYQLKLAKIVPTGTLGTSTDDFGVHLAGFGLGQLPVAVHFSQIAL